MDKSVRTTKTEEEKRIVQSGDLSEDKYDEISDIEPRSRQRGIEQEETKTRLLANSTKGSAKPQNRSSSYIQVTYPRMREYCPACNTFQAFVVVSTCILISGQEPAAISARREVL